MMKYKVTLNAITINDNTGSPLYNLNLEFDSLEDAMRVLSKVSESISKNQQTLSWPETINGEMLLTYDYTSNTDSSGVKK